MILIQKWTTGDEGYCSEGYCSVVLCPIQKVCQIKMVSMIYYNLLLLLG